MKICQKLLDVFLAEGHLILVDDKAGDAHDLIAFLQVVKMGKIIDFGGHIGMERRDVLRCNNQVRAHGAGERNQYLHVHRLVQSSNGLMSFCIQCLAGASGIVQAQHKGRELMPAGDAVEGQTCGCPIGQADLHAGRFLRGG